MALLSDPDPEIRAQAAHAFADIAKPCMENRLVELLRDESSRVRYFAALALGKLRYKPALEPVLAMLRENADRDAYLRHAGVMALHGIGDRDALLAHASDPSPAVRTAILLALRRAGDGRLVRFLDDAPLIQVEAARAIYDLPLGDAMGALAGLIDHLPPSSPGVEDTETTFALHRRVLNAHLRIGKPENVEAVTRYAADASRPGPMRREAIEILSAFAQPGPVDRVLGYYRPLDKRDPAMVRAALGPHIRPMLAAAGGDLAAVITLATKYNLELPAEKVAGYVKDSGLPAAVRIASLRALRPPSSASLVRESLNDHDPLVRAEALDLLAKLDPSAAVASAAGLLGGDGRTLEQQRALAMLKTLDHPEADRLLARELDLLAADKAPPAIRLDILEAAEGRKAGEAKKKLEAYLGSHPDRFALALQGGDAARGRELFYGHPSAQCLRCHSIHEAGGNAGPDMEHVASRGDRAYILESIVNPSAKIAPGFGTVAVVLKDGSTVAGLLKAEDGKTVTITTPDNKTRTIAIADITTRTPPISAMPPMGVILTPREVRDLVEFLSTLK